MTSAVNQYRISAENSLRELLRAIEWLDADTQAPDRWARLDAVAKRFEVSFEYVWKYLKSALEWQGTETPGPRAAIQNAVSYGWIEDADSWASYLNARNAGVHDYFGLSSEEYAAIARRYLSDASATLRRVPGE